MRRRMLGPWEARPFGLFMVKELLRHLEDCTGICRDLRNLEDLWPGTLSAELIEWASELEGVLLQLEERIPGGPCKYEFWVEV